MRYIIVGGGAAGSTAAEELRKLAPAAEIILIDQEQHRFYSRVLLPHYLIGQIDREKVFLKKESWYQEQKIEWLPGLSVVSLDTKNKHVVLSDGRELPYDKLLIASGLEPRLLEQDMCGVSYLRTLDDADHLLELINSGAKKVFLWGGGFISCDYLKIFHAHHLPVTVAFRGPSFWSSMLGAESWLIIKEYLEKNSVQVLPETSLEKIIGVKQVSGVVTNHGEIACDILAVGIGAVPDFFWMKDAGLKIKNVILTNEFLETNLPDVYAAGDIAEFKDVTVGRQLRVGTWANSMAQGRVAAQNMAGKRTEYRLVSSYGAHILDLHVVFIGDTWRAAAEEIVVQGSAKEGSVAELFYRQKKLVGAILVNRNTERKKLTEEIAS